MTATTAWRLLYAGALVLLVVGFAGEALDAFADRTVDGLSLLGLGLLGAGQAIRAAREGTPRAWIVLGLILVLAAIIALG